MCLRPAHPARIVWGQHFLCASMTAQPTLQLRTSRAQPLIYIQAQELLMCPRDAESGNIQPQTCSCRISFVPEGKRVQLRTFRRLISYPGSSSYAALLRCQGRRFQLRASHIQLRTFRPQVMCLRVAVSIYESISTAPLMGLGAGTSCCVGADFHMCLKESPVTNVLAQHGAAFAMPKGTSRRELLGTADLPITGTSRDN